MADLTDEQLAEWEQAADELVSVSRSGRVDNLIAAVPLLLRALRDARAEAWQHARICTAHAAKVAAERDALRAENEQLRTKLLLAEEGSVAELNELATERDEAVAANVVLRQRIEDVCVAWGDKPIPLDAFVGHIRTVLAAPTGAVSDARDELLQCIAATLAAGEQAVVKVAQAQQLLIDAGLAAPTGQEADRG